MKEKQYEVEIYSSYQNGRYGKTHYFGWILSATNKANAESFALDILAGMTPNEIMNESDGKCGQWFGWYNLVPIGNGVYRHVTINNDAPIGYEFAERRFTIKSRVFKG